MTQLQRLKDISRLSFVPLLLFTYLAIPPVLVMFEVPKIFGLSWAFSIFLLTFYICSVSVDAAWKRYTLFVLFLALTLLNTALAISFSIQGTAFNTAFFTHLDMSTVLVALKTDMARLMAVLFYLLASPIIFQFASRHVYGVKDLLHRTPVTLKWVILFLALLTNYPLQAIALYEYATARSSQRLLDEIDTLKNFHDSTPATSVATQNLVLIYLESLERYFLDDTLFPGLTPNLNKLKDRAIWFEDVHQFPGTNWTIGGIVSSQCGVPLLTDGHGNRILATLDNPFRQITCLAEFLKEKGYQTAYLGGASLNFAGKGNFLRDNGYDLALGFDELPSSTAHKWGLYDDELFSHGKKLLDSLAASGHPFLLTLLTLDTHHPFGNPSPSCARYLDSDETLLNAVHCSDQLVGNFLDHISQSEIAEDTVIALVSDHLLIMGNPLETLKTKDRRILFAIIDPRRPPFLFKGSSTHFDIAPTLLEAVGISETSFAFGHSLLSEQEGKAFLRGLTEADFQGFRIEQLVNGAVLADGIVYRTNYHQLSVGETIFNTRSGDHMDLRMFTGGDGGEFLALLFDSITDRYPTLLNTPKDLENALATVEAGIIVAAAQGVTLCLADIPCTGKHFLMVYNLENHLSVVKNQAEKLTISPAEIRGILKK